MKLALRETWLLENGEKLYCVVGNCLAATVYSLIPSPRTDVYSEIMYANSHI